MGFIRLVAVVLAAIAGIGSLVARLSPSHWPLFELILVIGAAAVVSRLLSSHSKASAVKQPVTSSDSGWFAGLSADLRDVHARYFHAWDVEQAALRSAAMDTFPARTRAVRARRSVEEMLMQAFHIR